MRRIRRVLAGRRRTPSAMTSQTPSPRARSRAPKQALEQAQAALARAHRTWVIAVVVAALLTLIGIGVLVLTMVFLTIADRSATSSNPAPLYLVAEDRTQTEKWLVGAPGVLLLLAIVVAFLAELYRRATWKTVDRGFIQGGSRTVDLVALPVRTHVAGMITALVAWAILILGPAVSELGHGWPVTLHSNAHHAAWSLLVAYGGISAGLGGASAASLLKKRTYDTRAERGAASIIAGSATTRFWRWFSFRWRLELWLAGIGGAILGGTSVAILFSAPTTWLTLGGVGLALAIVSVVLCLNAWRSGESLYRGESVS